ncbi:VanZ family protein [Kineosporia succinea]|uniref:FtsH-binding integral membrane protein n=1 Tax=Kineosporia succinea TaxID=84632 RepID=A0ABT9P5L7_9ACTN|nr:VanZ family protein [Kineosporia succinea]MDP9827989.1 FtsH-binding integral membrane protein [Kineosporia succinea]
MEGYWFYSALFFLGDFGSQLVLDLVVAGIALVCAFLVRRRQAWFGLTPWAVCLTVGSLAVIAISTLSPRTGDITPGRLQLEPLATLRVYRYHPADLLMFVGGNVLMFVPLGLFLYLAVRRSVLLCAVATTLVSVGVEVLQLGIWTRSTDIDDVITNGFGGLLGVLLGAVLVRFGTRDASGHPERSGHPRLRPADAVRRSS